MSKHTPGPWVKRMLGGGKGGPNAYAVRLEKDDGTAKSAIAKCSAGNGSAKANAQLIAAAPELLEALKALVVWQGLEHEEDCPADDTCDCKAKKVGDLVNSAIRKAEGR